MDGRQQIRHRYGKGASHHRGPRAGHVFKGVTQELGSAICLLVKMPDRVTRLTKPRSLQVASAFKGTGSGTQNEEAGKVSTCQRRVKCVEKGSGQS